MSQSNHDVTGRGLFALEIALAAGAFALLCAIALAHAPQLPEPDDLAYRASIVAVADGHLLTLSTVQVRLLAAQLTAAAGPQRAVLFGPGPLGGSIEQWVRLANGRWFSEKDPGYPFLAAPFQALGIIRLAPLCYGAIACAALFFGARRWLGRFGGAVAVALFCSSGAALIFAWRDYMPTFTEAALIAVGAGALLWATLAAEAAPRLRISVGLAGFLAIEAAVFTRYTDIVVLGCAVIAVLAVRWRQPGFWPAGTLWWWLGSVAVFCAGLGLFDDLVYGGPLRSGYPPGEIRFSLGSVPANLRRMPPHLTQAMPMLVLGVAALTWIGWRRLTAARAADGAAIRADAGIATTLGAAWLGIWALYFAYSWTTPPGLTTMQASRFYVPAIGPIALLAAWLVTRLPRSAPAATVLTIAAVAVMAGMGLWAFGDMLPVAGRPVLPPHCTVGTPNCAAPRGRAGASLRLPAHASGANAANGVITRTR
jgi:hypothetical protein